MARGKVAEPVEPSQEELGAAEAGEATEQVEAEAETTEIAAEPVEPKPKKAKARMEKFEATRPDGTVVVVTRNIDTGEQTVTDKK